MPFTGVEWTFQARDLGFMEEIESDEEHETIQVQADDIPSYPVEMEMADLSVNSSSTSTTVRKVHTDTSLESIMEDSEIAI